MSRALLMCSVLIMAIGSLLPQAAASQSRARPSSGLFGGLGVCVLCGGLVY